MYGVERSVVVLSRVGVVVGRVEGRAEGRARLDDNGRVGVHGGCVVLRLTLVMLVRLLGRSHDVCVYLSNTFDIGKMEESKPC